MGAISHHAQAWTEFWRGQGDANGCCANAPEILGPLKAHWSSFAQGLVRDSRVLDLGCGAGSAAEALVDAHASLHVIGIDFASLQTHADPRIEIMPGIRMESLPFADRSYDAAVSQFGFEYGRVEDASRELARVLKRGAPISLLVHHGDAPIATDSIRHRAALQAICGREVEACFLSGGAGLLQRQLTSIRHQYPRERIVDEAAQGLLRLIGEAPEHRIEIWRGVQAALAPELVMLADLESAAVAPAAMSSWLEPLQAYFEISRPVEMLMTSGRLLCWKVEGIRKTALH